MSKIELCKHCEKKGALQQLHEEEILVVARQYIHEESFVIAWFNQRVTFGKYLDGTIIWAEGLSFDVKQFQELRIFNEKEEFYLKGKNWRYLSDEQGEDIEYVDSYSRFWGEKQDETQGFVLLEDKGRKLKMVVPNVGEGNYYELYLRSYVGYDSETGQAGYTAYRYLKIVAVVR